MEALTRLLGRSGYDHLYPERDRWVPGVVEEGDGRWRFQTPRGVAVVYQGDSWEIEYRGRGVYLEGKDGKFRLEVELPGAHPLDLLDVAQALEEVAPDASDDILRLLKERERLVKGPSRPPLELG